MTKTFTRARAARSALAKLVEAYEIPAPLYHIDSVESAETGRYFARLVLDASQIDEATLTLLTADLDGKFEYIFPPVAEAEEKPKAAPRKTNYINETSSVIKPTKMVHIIADSMPEATRAEVIAECRARGIAYGTARTQYQVWKKAR